MPGVLRPKSSRRRAARRASVRVRAWKHQEVSELIQFGVFHLADHAPVWTFHSRTVILARRAARLRDDFGLNVSGMALALTYLERIEALEGRLRELESQLPR